MTLTAYKIAQGSVPSFLISVTIMETRSEKNHSISRMSKSQDKDLKHNLNP